MPHTQLFQPAKTVQVLKLPFPTGRIVAIGDVHGCLEELKELWSKINPTIQDTVVFLGDLVDRGPDSEGVIRFIHNLTPELNIYNVASNHDERPIRYHYHQLKAKENPKYKVPMKLPESYLQLSESSLEFLAQAPHAVFFSKEGTVEPYDVVCVHAGISPSLFNQDPKQFIRNRYFIRNEKTNRLTPVKSIEIDGIWHVPELSYPWYDFWDGHWTVVFGHSVHETPFVKNNCIGIDGGCSFGGVLRAWVKPCRGDSYFVEVKPKLFENLTNLKRGVRYKP